MITTYKSSLKIDCNETTFQQNNKIRENLIQKNNSSFEIDRIFVCVQDGDRAIAILKQFGLYFPDTVIVSESEGTRSQICFLDNRYLAIVWLKDERSRSSSAINFPARVNWQDSRASPFGVGLSRIRDTLPLSWDDYPVENLTVDRYIAYSKQNQRNIIEPSVFFLPDRLKYSKILNRELPKGKRYRQHPLGVKNITDIKISVQAGKRRNSEIINWLDRERLLDIDRADAPLMELTFDKWIQGKIFDARPTLPIVFHY
ncbi:MAG: hypothetical protein AAGE96_09425 [Cyanobacteria bacterium P01_G01_bin.19]